MDTGADTVVARIVAPAGAVGFAAFAESRHLGLLNADSAASLISFLVSLLGLDLEIYFQHRLFHGLPLLWCLHRMHHAKHRRDEAHGRIS